MDKLGQNPNKKVSVRAHQGDAMTLLAFNISATIKKNFTGFSIRVNPPKGKTFYIWNMISYTNAILQKNGIDKFEKLSSEFSPIQKFRWVHVPSSIHNVEKPVYGKYIYEVTPRYMKDGMLMALDESLTAKVSIDVGPYEKGKIKIGFSRAFVASQAYARAFGNNNKMRPNKEDLLFNIKKKSGSVDVTDENGNTKTRDYTFEDQHKYLGWQARMRIVEFLDETIKDKDMRLDVFAYDLNEPTITEKLLKLAEDDRLRIILDNAGEHAKADSWEGKFETLFKKAAPVNTNIFRGHFGGLNHSKVFIQTKNEKAVKVLTGSTNFTTNGVYINANHVVIFNIAKVAQLYEDVFEASWGEANMKKFKKSSFAESDHIFTTPEMTIWFSPHGKAFTDTLFDRIRNKILTAKSDVPFAIMIDTSQSSILDAVKQQVRSDKVYTYGISDSTGDVYLYKPTSKRGIKVAGKGISNVLPPPFNKESKIPGHNIHHKFVVVDFKKPDGVVYCGSSNLAYNPEQKNGDNLLEIRDRDIVTVFAIEAIRLVDHFHFRNRKMTKGIFLRDGTESPKWYEAYYDSSDLKYRERTLLIS